MAIVTVTHLVLARADFRDQVLLLPDEIELKLEPTASSGQMAWECYRRVGESWNWIESLDQSVVEWEQEIVANDGELWVARHSAQLAGYFLLQRQGDAIEISYFGLTAGFTGRGLGRALLQRAVNRCWELGFEAVTLNTCDLDSPAALPNYLARGFKVIRTEQRELEVPRGTR